MLTFRADGDPLILAMGIGGAGIGTLEGIDTRLFAGVRRMVIDADAQALAISSADVKVQVEADDMDWMARVKRELHQAEAVFVIAGLGGKTGSGIAPVVAKRARDRGCLTIGLVTLPDSREGHVRVARAQAGLEGMTSEVDTCIAIPLPRIFNRGLDTMSLSQGFSTARTMLCEICRSLLYLLAGFDEGVGIGQEVRAFLQTGGLVLNVGIGRASGPDRSALAAQQAILKSVSGDVPYIKRGTALVHLSAAQPELREAEIALKTLDAEQALWAATPVPDMQEDFQVLVYWV